MPIPEFLKENTTNLIDEHSLQGTSTIEGVVNNKFLVIMNYSEQQAEKLKSDIRFKQWYEESNPVLVLFSIK